jgi:hypothetical protein
MTLREHVDQQHALLPQSTGPHSELAGATRTALALPAHNANDPGSSDLLHPPDNLTQHPHHCLLIEVAEEIKIDWPGFFDWKLSTIVSPDYFLPPS